jgi:hypothetical protein
MEVTKKPGRGETAAPITAESESGIREKELSRFEPRQGSRRGIQSGF